MSEVPKKCPLLGICKELVTQEVFDAVCTSNAWVFCSTAKKKAKEYMKTPKEWLKGV